MNLNNYKTVFFIGIGGMGMRALAAILLDKGFAVKGSDKNNSDFLKDIASKGAEVFIGHKAEHVHGADCVIISTAIAEDNPELVEAKRLGIPVFHRSDVLASVLSWGKAITVAGAHGKSTTSAMIGEIFFESGEDPTIVLGASASYINGNSYLGKGDYVIAEADESDGSFLKFNSYVTVVMNIEDDHLDHYGSIENIRKAFVEFIEKIHDASGAAILCNDSEGIRAVIPSIDKKIITYGIDVKSDYMAVNRKYENGYFCFDVIHENDNLGTINLQIPGVHNTRDALGAVATALYCEIPFDKIAAALSNFCGVKRRFETKAKIDDLWIIDDYAHHPTEIKATLKGARETGSRRMICAFQPHRYSRTKLLKDEFADAFVDADVIFFTDIYSAGEKPIEGIDGKLIPEIVKAKFPDKEVYYVENVNDLPEKLYDFLRPHDMFITMGAGNIYTAGEKLIELIKEKGIASDYKK